MIVLITADYLNSPPQFERPGPEPDQIGNGFSPLTKGRFSCFARNNDKMALTDSHLLLQEFPPNIWLNFAKWLQNHIGYLRGYKNDHEHVIVTEHDHNLSRLLI